MRPLRSSVAALKGHGPRRGGGGAPRRPRRAGLLVRAAGRRFSDDRAPAAGSTGAAAPADEIAIIEAVARERPEVPQVACFDTAFHRRMPDVAQRLPLPRELWEGACGATASTDCPTSTSCGSWATPLVGASSSPTSATAQPRRRARTDGPWTPDGPHAPGWARHGNAAGRPRSRRPSLSPAGQGP